MRFILFDLFIAARQTERDYILIMDTGITKAINLQPSSLKTLFAAGVIIIAGFIAIGPQDDVFNAHLTNKVEVCMRGFGRDLRGDFHAGREGGEGQRDSPSIECWVNFRLRIFSETREIPGVSSCG